MQVTFPNLDHRSRNDESLRRARASVGPRGLLRGTASDLITGLRITADVILGISHIIFRLSTRIR